MTVEVPNFCVRPLGGLWTEENKKVVVDTMLAEPVGADADKFMELYFKTKTASYAYLKLQSLR